MKKYTKDESLISFLNCGKFVCLKQLQRIRFYSSNNYKSNE